MGPEISSRDLARLILILEGQLPAVLAEVRDRFRPDWPDYAQFLDREQDEVSAAGRAFIAELVHLADGSATAAPNGETASLFEWIGRVQYRESRELSSVLSAYQVGGRVAWRHVSRAALKLGVSPEELAALAEAVFVFIDRLCSASARGYVWEQSHAMADRERLRDELVSLLLSGRSDLVAVRVAAARVGWRLPGEAAVILAEPDNPVGQASLSRLDGLCLPIRGGDLLGAVVPDPTGPGRRERLAQALRGAGAVVGHAVSLEQLPASFSIAQTAAELRRSGLLCDDPVFAEEHLDSILVHREPRLLEALRRRVLAPLDGQPEASRERLIETLSAWLRHFGDRKAVAAELHVHPQTVRYRMAQLHALLGPDLESTRGRAQLMLALAWSHPDPPSAFPPGHARVTPRSG